MPPNEDMRDVSFLLRKAEEYRAKAKNTNDAALKVAFEAAAREFDLRAKKNAKENTEENAAKSAAKDSKPRGA